MNAGFAAIATPVKASSAAAQEILSPTPYYKVLEERGGKASPRLTRSAAKREQTERAMRELDQLDHHNNDYDSEREEAKNTPPFLRLSAGPTASSSTDGLLLDSSARISLQFQPPDRHDWQRRQSKVRKSIQPTSSVSRYAKRAKYNNNETIMNADQVRQIMTETLQNHYSSTISHYNANDHQDKLLQLSADAAASKKEVEVYKLQLEQLDQKYDALNEVMKIKEQSENEIRIKLKEKVDQVKILEKELEMVRDGKKKHEDHANTIQRLELEISTVKEQHHELEVRANCTLSELDVVKAKLKELNQRNVELQSLRESACGSNTELVERVSKLEREKADLIEIRVKNEQEVMTLKSTLTMKEDEYEEQLNRIKRENEDILSRKDEIIQQLKANLDDADQRLDDANKTMDGMQSPTSRDAMESEFTQQVEMLQKEIRGMKHLLKQMNQTNETLQQQLGESNEENGTLLAQIQGLKSQMEDVSGTRRTAELENENSVIVEQLNATTRGLKESQQQLEDKAVECEQVLSELDEKENKLQQTIHQMELQSKQLTDITSKFDLVTSEKDSLLSENDSLATDLSNVQDEVYQLQSEVRSLKDDLTNSHRYAESLFAQKNESDQKLLELSNQLESLTTHLEAAQNNISTLEDKLCAKNKYCEQFEEIERKLTCEKNVLNEIRRALHNKVIQLTGNIRVYIRVRPLISSEQQLSTATTLAPPRPSSSALGRPSSRASVSSSSSQHQDEQCFHFPGLADRKVGASKSPNYTSFSDLSKQTIELTEPQRDRGGLNPRRKRWKYGFDKVFNPINDQADVWDGAEPLVQSAIDGHNVCMFAYGQTGSGKTHTMIGDTVNLGLIPRAVEKLFASKREIEESFQDNVSVSIKVELLEIYNEEVYDLLDSAAGPNGQKVKIKLSSNEAVNNIVLEASSQDEVQGVLQLAQQRRCVKATKSNAESSRSHLLFTIRFELSSLTIEEMNRQGVLHIVDLAGSERLDKSGSQGTLLTEAKHINTSLSALSHVMQKLQEKSEHIPYRDSKLTYLLRDSLGGDSKTLCIVCCSPHQAHFNESLNSIRFAANASKVELKQGNKVDV